MYYIIVTFCIFGVIQIGMSVWLCVLAYRNKVLKQELADMRIRDIINNKEDSIRQAVILEQLKHRLDSSHGLRDIQVAYRDRIEHVRERFPQLTDADVSVLLLLGLGTDNQTILMLLDLSKRTYYKRRQLISKRMQIQTAALDETARQIFTPKY